VVFDAEKELAGVFLRTDPVMFNSLSGIPGIGKDWSRFPIFREGEPAGKIGRER